MKRKLPILFLLLFITMEAVTAQKSEFIASAPATVQSGQQFQYTIEGSERGEINLPPYSNLEVLAGPFTSYSSSTQWVNGRMTATTTASYTYVFRATEEGEITIPPAKVKVNRSEYTTNQVKISVVASPGNSNKEGNSAQNGGGQQTTAASDESDPVYLRVLPTKKEVFVGEQLVSEVKIYTRVNTRPTSGLKDIPYEGFYKHAIDPDQTSKREVINGETYITQVLQRHILIPQKSGKMVIEPVESEWTIPQRVQRQRQGSVFDDFFTDPFNDPFFSSVQNVPVKILTKPVAIKVKPFPEGAPSGFTGGVGQLNMSASLSSNKVSENDALSMIVKISGTGNISLLGAPEVNFPPDHDVYEPTRNEKINLSGNRLSGTVTFEFPMVARHAGTFRISPIKFSWFDPLEKKYKTIETDEFIFTVEKGKGGVQNEQVFIPGMRAENVEDIGTDILDIERVVPDFSSVGYSLLNKIWYWLIFPGLFLLAMITGVFLRLYFKQRANVRLTKNRKANKLARKRLKKADKARKLKLPEQFFEETEKAIWGYLSDKLGIELSSLSRDKVLYILQSTSVTEEVKNELFSIMEECEFSRYAPSQEKSDMDQLYQESIKLINKLEHSIQSSK